MRGKSLMNTDFNMPEMDGLALARRIKKDSPGTAVIVMTGADDIQIEEIRESACVESILKKPFRWEELEEAVAIALTGRSPLSDRDKITNANAFDFKEQYRI